MKKIFNIITFIFIITLPSSAQNLRLGADKIDKLTNILQDKKVALVINQTSLLSNRTNLLDTLIVKNVEIMKIFAPEHGFRGNADAGETIKDGKDFKTGIPVISLYGKNYKPKPYQLADIDVVVFDIQDVGARFYTYISTMHYIMEACAENDKKCIILDRPNPKDRVDGTVLDLRYKSFVGMHPIPILHGLTIGELALMINGENWLANNKKCDLTVVPMDGWVHGQPYSLPIKPSPNLPNDQSINLYPSLCFFEATAISVARGTDFPFQAIGAPSSQYGDFVFVPRSTEGAKNPMYKNLKCYGLDLRDWKNNTTIELDFLISFYKKSHKGAAFFTSPKFMDMLAGTNKLRLQIIEGKSSQDIVNSWIDDLNKYKLLRKKYLLYPDYRKNY